MTQPVSDIIALWNTSESIQLSWTAPSDVTVESKYKVYVYTSSNTWTLVGSVLPQAKKQPGESQHVLTNANTSYAYPWASFIGLWKIVPYSVVFKIVHIDLNGDSDDGTTVLTLPKAIQKKVGTPHLSNNFKMDEYGQLMTNPQDSYEEISESVAMLLGTVRGQRTAVPNYGIDDLPLHQIDVRILQAAIEGWEPRARADINVTYDDNNNASVQVGINTGGIL
jgi:phage baseplate assembly protein W